MEIYELMENVYNKLRNICIFSGWTGVETPDGNAVWRHPQNELEYYQCN